MKKIILAICSGIVLWGCDKKDNIDDVVTCDIEQAYKINEQKVTINTGVWGTVSMMEGNCMPIVGPGSTCKNCPVKRTVRVYEYTLRSQATPAANMHSSFYESFSTNLLKETVTDENGFFQFDLAPGKYTMVVVEDGKLYASGTDGVGGLNPLDFTAGGKLKANLMLIYKASF